jgi:hypothetical protein
MKEDVMKKTSNTRRVVVPGRASAVTRAVATGLSDEFGNYPMQWPI